MADFTACLRPRPPGQRRVFGGVVAVLALSCAAGTPAQTPTRVTADVTIAPTRLVFHGGPQTAQVALSRPGAPVVFDVSLVDRAMLADGRIVERSAPGALSARPMVAVAPPTVRLGEGQRQSLSVAFSGSGARPPGEYRTHLTLTPPETPTTPPPPGGPPNVRLTYSIPIIVRVGPADVRAGLAHLRMTQTAQSQPALAFDLLRLGANSVYGDIEVRASNGDPAAPPLVAMRGVAVYPEVASRPIVLPLGRDLDDGEAVRIDYVDRDTQPGHVLASAAFSRDALVRYARLTPVAAAPVLRRRAVLVEAVAAAFGRLRAEG